MHTYIHYIHIYYVYIYIYYDSTPPSTTSSTYFYTLLFDLDSRYHPSNVIDTHTIINTITIPYIEQVPHDEQHLRLYAVICFRLALPSD